jgi:SAM-dependent methyltransferase
MRPDQFALNHEYELRHWWFVARRQILCDLIARVLPPDPQTLVVDVGCGTGANLAALSQRYRAVGIDPSPEAIRLASERHPGAQFLLGRAPEDLGELAAQARLFLVADVLEHVPDDFHTFSRLLVAARPGACFLLTVPADPALWSPHDESHGHYRRYDRARLEALWQGLPVEPLLVSPFGARLQPVVKAVRALTRRRGRALGRAGTDVGETPRALNEILRRIFAGESARLLAALDGRALGYRRGTSLLALLRRREGAASARRHPAAEATLAGLLASPRGAPGGRARCAIVVPCFDEAARLDAAAFHRFALEGHGCRFLFVDDGSTDATPAILEALRELDPERFAVKRLAHNAGKAEAVRLGMLDAIDSGAELAGYWDADLSTPLDAIPAFCEILAKTPELQMVLGSRVRLLGRSIQRTPLRHYLGRVFATFASLVLELPVYDTQCGAKLFRSSPETRALFAKPWRTNWIFDVELLARFVRERRRAGASAGAAIHEAPLERWRDVAGSKLGPADFVRAAFQLLRVRAELRARERT